MHNSITVHKYLNESLAYEGELPVAGSVVPHEVAGGPIMATWPITSPIVRLAWTGKWLK